MVPLKQILMTVLALDLSQDSSLAGLHKDNRITAVLIGASAVAQLQNYKDSLKNGNSTNAELYKSNLFWHQQQIS